MKYVYRALVAFSFIGINASGVFATVHQSTDQPVQAGPVCPV